jgi:membrane dipeptidase
MSLRLDDVPKHPLEKGWHTPGTTPYLFIDGCVQVWPDTDYRTLSGYSPTAYCITTFLPYDGLEVAFDAMANWHRIGRHYEGIRLALRADDIREAKDEGRAAIVLAAQGGDVLAANLERLQAFHALGLRMMIPAYNTRNALCDGLFESADAGLSRLGERWVDECNRLGVLIDCTHVGELSTLEIMERSRDPVVFSHSNPRALVDNVRNISDEQIRRCAAGGVVVALTNWGPLNYRAGSRSRPTLSQFLDAVDYVVDLVGIDHVGIGTDMSTGTYPDGDLIRGLPGKGSVAGEYAEYVDEAPRSRLRYVEGFDDYGQLPNVAEALVGRGHDEDAVAKVLGGNFLRVFERVWR